MQSRENKFSRVHKCVFVLPRGSLMLFISWLSYVKMFKRAAKTLRPRCKAACAEMTFPPKDWALLSVTERGRRRAQSLQTPTRSRQSCITGTTRKHKNCAVNVLVGFRSTAVPQAPHRLSFIIKVAEMENRSVISFWLGWAVRQPHQPSFSCHFSITHLIYAQSSPQKADSSILAGSGDCSSLSCNFNSWFYLFR